jgi:hypothetical protein
MTNSLKKWLSRARAAGYTRTEQTMLAERITACFSQGRNQPTGDVTKVRCGEAYRTILIRHVFYVLSDGAIRSNGSESRNLYWEPVMSDLGDHTEGKPF